MRPSNSSASCLFLVLILLLDNSVIFVNAQYTDAKIIPDEWTIMSGDAEITYYVVIVGEGKVSLSIKGLPSGTSAKFDPPTGSSIGTFSSKLTIKIDRSTPLGSHRLAVSVRIGDMQIERYLLLKIVPRTGDGARIVLYNTYARYLDPNFYADALALSLSIYGSDFSASFTDPLSVLKKVATSAVAPKLKLAEDLAKIIITMSSSLRSAGISHVLTWTCIQPSVCGECDRASQVLREISQLIEQGNKEKALEEVKRALPWLREWLSRVEMYQPQPISPASQADKEAVKNLLSSLISFLESEMQQNISAGSDIVFVLDVSGSMNEEWKGEIKMDSAKRSAIYLLKTLSSDDRVSVVTFESTADLKLSLTGDKNKVADVIRGLSAGGTTNMGDALIKALEELKKNARPDARMKAVIFFTDGMLNTGMTEEEILSGPVKEAISMGVKIYTIGYGNPSELNEKFLRALAERTGGKYYYSTDAYQLENDFLEAGQLASGMKLISKFSGKVKQGELSTAGKVDVSGVINLLKIILNWRGSILDLRILDPNGNPVNLSSPNVEYSGETKPKYVVIHSPAQGRYIVQVYGREVSGEEDYNVWIFGIAAVVPPSPLGGGGGGGGRIPKNETAGGLSQQTGQEGYEWIIIASALVATFIISLSLYYRYRPSYYLLDRGGRILLRSSESDRIYGREDFMGMLSPQFLNFITRREKGGQFRIFRSGRDYYIVDYYSTNPTYLNNVQIKGKGPVKLENGSIISVPGVLEVIFQYS